jgi:hypothetical protein
MNDSEKITELKVRLKRDKENKSLKKFLSNIPFLRQSLYSKQKALYFPEWLMDMKYKESLLNIHDMIIEECTGTAAYILEVELLEKLNEYYKQGIPLSMQLKFFQMLELTKRYSLNDILNCFNDSFVNSCRELYKKYKKFEKDFLSGKIKLTKSML